MPYEDGRVAYEEGTILLQEGKTTQALEKFIIAMFESYEKSYTSIGTLLIGPNNGYANPQLAKDLFEMGVASGHSRAMFNLARMYEKGDGITQSDEMALDLYKQAQAIEPTNSAFVSKVNILENRISTKEKTKPSATPDDFISTSSSSVSSTRGDVLYQQAITLQKQGNHSAAFQTYMQASFMGNTKAYSSIALYLITGIPVVVPINKVLAKKYLEMGVAAEQPIAMYNLARMYEKGDGVVQSYKIAMDLYSLAQIYDSSNVSITNKINRLEKRVSEDLRLGPVRVNSPLRADLNAKKNIKPLTDAEIKATCRDDLRQIVTEMKINSDLSAEINAGTASTPGEHLRFSAYPQAYNKLAALKSALDVAGISYEEKQKGMGGIEKILVIREAPFMGPGFKAKLRQNYVAALEKITAEANAERARTDGKVDRKQALRIVYDNLKALSVSSIPYSAVNS